MVLRLFDDLLVQSDELGSVMSSALSFTYLIVARSRTAEDAPTYIHRLRRKVSEYKCFCDV